MLRLHHPPLTGRAEESWHPKTLRGVQTSSSGGEPELVCVWTLDQAPRGQNRISSTSW
ncbi:unnamed protein product [Tetraodon nigroviridis]|uniref:Chromosome 14 SCAF15120, whole genome shotgun sequence n=1 Tax=Tetraodon nigroviridis TaxID=99883 RepID=Q4RF84_TETNG|nr:unnamed protein product [Tetraodon nigroviridis]